MPLDPQIRALLDELEAANELPIDTLPVPEARRSMYDRLPLAIPPGPVAKVEDRQISGPLGPLPIRIYTPDGNGPFPVLIYFHGGGWVIGDLEVYDSGCRALTDAVQCITLSVDYRLAPEHRFPAAAEDCYAATRWVAENCATINGDPTRIAIAGDSAGGNLAAVVALMARDRGTPRLLSQTLIYPVTDHYTAGYASYEEYADGHYLTRDSMIWFWNHYTSNENDARHPYASPLRAPDLHNLPPALVITAECDPLRDEGERYAARLREAGVPVTLTRYPGAIHGFVYMAGALDLGKQAFSQIVTELRKAFAPQSTTEKPGGKPLT